MASIKNRVVEIYTTPSIMESSDETSKLVVSLCKNLPPHFKLKGVEDKDRNTDAEPTFLLVLGVSLLSMGRVFQAFHEGNFEKIIVCDSEVYEFDAKKLIMQFMQSCMQREINRIGTKDRNEITRRLDSLVMIKTGSDIGNTLNYLDGQLNDVIAKKRAKELEAPQTNENSNLKDEKLKSVSGSGAAGMMELLEDMVN